MHTLSSVPSAAPRRVARIGPSCALVLVFALGLASGARAQIDPFEIDEPPPPQAVCPAIDDGYELCRSGGSSADCEEFVSGARALSRLYLFTVQREPDKAEQLRTTIWWPCGSATIPEIAALLAKVDTPEARETLAGEPYRGGPVPKPEQAGGGAAPQPQVTAIDCESPLTDADRKACDQRLLDVANANHARLYDRCRAALDGPDLADLEAGEQNWKTELAAQCHTLPCERQSVIQRDTEIVDAYPQCGAPVLHPYTAGITHQAKTGMLAARWTPPEGQGETRQVPFSYDVTKKSRGTMSTTLGKGGERFHGGYVRLEHGSRDPFVDNVYEGWAIPDWAVFGPDGGAGWVATGVSWTEFARLYTGQVVASLEGDRGHHMRCKLELYAPQAGLAGGGKGACQVSDGGTLELSF